MTPNDFYPARCLATVLAICFGFVGAPAYAVHNGDLDLFELDGNATDDGQDGEDWQNVYQNNDSSAATTGIVSDLQGASTFEIGSKDTLDVSTWHHGAGSSPPKDEITNAYAAKYVAAAASEDGTVLAGDQIIYTGLDRYATNGTANAGFWFFQQAVTLNDDGTFKGNHVVGDLLLVVEFTGGGKVANARVYRWNGTTIVLVQSLANADCSAAHATGDPCGRSNAGSVTLPWPYVGSKSLGTNVAAAGAFVEFGINISRLGRQNNFTAPCFASFLATTRTSVSDTATIKDFAGPHNFEACGLSVTKNCAKGGGGDGFNDDFSKYVYDFSGTVTSSSGTLFDVEVVEGTPSNPGPVISTLATVGAGGANWTPFSQESDTPIASNTLFARAAVSDGGPKTVLADAVTATCPPISASPNLSINKACRTCLTLSGGGVKVNVHAEGQVCNEGNIPLTNVFVIDEIVDDKGTPATSDDTYTPIGSGHSIGGLAVGACASYSDDYSPSVAYTNIPHDASFSDRATATATTLLGFAVPDESAPATCSICPASTEPGGNLVCPPLSSQ